MRRVKRGSRAASPALDGDAVVRAAVRRAQHGDEAGVVYLYARFSVDVRHKVAGVLGDEHDAEDVTQEVFSRLPRTIRQYEDRGLPFGAWLMRVARNAALDELRRQRPIPVAELPAWEPASELPASSEELSDAL